MRISSGRRLSVNHLIGPAAAFFALQICLTVSCPPWLSGKDAGLIRRGVMVDPSVCECSGLGKGWRDIETAYFKVSADGDVDMGTVERNLRKRLFFIGRRAPSDAGVNAYIAYRLDAICERAMDILNVRPKMAGINIKVFKSVEDLASAYRMLTGKSSDMKAFYVQDCRTIYTCEECITDSVMAHEIAHAIVDNYYNGIPPPNVGEMLASYVDMHISD